MSINSTTGDRRQRSLADSPRFVRSRIVVAVSAVAVLVASYAYAPFVNGGPVLCPVHGLIGLPCPSCGLTRAFCRLARLDLFGALSYHALSVPLFAVFLAAPVMCAYEVLRRRECRLHSLLYSRHVAWGLAAFMSVYHVIRMVVWLSDGTLVNDYVKTSWTYTLLTAMGFAGA